MFIMINRKKLTYLFCLFNLDNINSTSAVKNNRKNESSQVESNKSPVANKEKTTTLTIIKTTKECKVLDNKKPVNKKNNLKNKALIEKRNNQKIALANKRKKNQMLTVLKKDFKNFKKILDNIKLLNNPQLLFFNSKNCYTQNSSVVEKEFNNLKKFLEKQERLRKIKEENRKRQEALKLEKENQEKKRKEAEMKKKLEDLNSKEKNLTKEIKVMKNIVKKNHKNHQLLKYTGLSLLAGSIMFLLCNFVWALSLSFAISYGIYTAAIFLSLIALKKIISKISGIVVTMVALYFAGPKTKIFKETFGSDSKGDTSEDIGELVPQQQEILEALDGMLS